MITIWAALWRSRNKADGLDEHIIFDDAAHQRQPLRPVPALFRSRQKARQFINEKYGYIKTRPDLQAEPHGWRMPRAVRVKIVVEKFNRARRLLSS